MNATHTTNEDRTMTTNTTNEIEAGLVEVTSAKVTVEALSDGKISVTGCWPETEGEDGDHCHGQATILREAYKVLSALEAEGWEHTAFGGSKDMGHSGGGCHFACEFTGKPMAEDEE